MTTKLIVLACLLAVANARFVGDFKFDISTLTSRIIGGHDAKQGDFPHQISLQVKFPENGIKYFTHICGGSIIDKQWILTAAHCLIPLETADPRVVVAIKAGKHDLTNTEDTEQTAFIDIFFVHERYDRKQKVGPFDIGLIKLKKPLRLNKRVVAINLPKQSSEPTGKVILSGWGAINANGEDPDMPYILQTVDLEVIDRATCNQQLRELLEGQGQTYDALVDETNICSGPTTGGISACGGDSGGPLISKDGNGRTEIVGIVSWGIDPCGLKGAPSVYTRTSSFIDWIQNVMSSH